MLAFDAPPTLDDVLAGRDTVAIEQRLDKDVSELRLSALKAVALQVGTQAGFQRRSYEIEQSIKEQAPRLDQVYNFQGLILDNNVVPPVLVEARDVVRAPDDSTLRLADTTFEIVIQAKFATATPSWRDYLVRGNALTPTTYKPDPVMTPRNDAERKFWQAQVAAGWEAGEKQAELVFQSELARLNRDFKGMVLYRSLLYRNMVSKPFVSEARMGVTGDGNKIAINDRVLRIVAKPQLETRSDRWNAPILPARPTAAGEGGAHD
ncbi:type IV secretory system conjugative DNA transfer family protein [Pseudoxanthomonas kaohsiungensis]|uniref:Type IV secretory system conjugative DNA transfer family protein n=1 Tax=Pseudoxanthomonas kaohsiungensis TaxID=283923 RepID=A0ABW3M0I3_9GAMM|nr:type IV secretory system conjugative DNA transfer family protein [Pseudoxanthomonas kaohsiungensis]KAF1702968.1 type IV secretion system protein DotC [Pseudoxanthomonas kaohsiungensis]